MAGSAPILREIGASQAAPDYNYAIQYVLTAGTGVNTASLRAPQLMLSNAIGGGTGSAIASLSQALCDQAMDEVGGVVAATAFGTTAMVDNDTYGGVIGYAGQIRELGIVSAIVVIAGTATNLRAVPTRTPFTNAAFTGLQVYISPAGNLAWRLTVTNVSAAATAGEISIFLPLYLK